MKKINKVLALGLVGVSALTGGLMLAGCDITEDKDKTQTEQSQDEQKAVSSISLNADTLPSYIIKGKFARTNIKMTVTYEDNTIKVIDVTESMLDETSKEEIKYVGQYNLSINYGGKTATMYANVVDERYLLKEVVEANLDKDVTLTAGNNSCQIDMDNKIIKYTDVSDGWVGYTWLSNNITYDYEPYEDNICNKSLGSEWARVAYSDYTADILEILATGKDGEGDTWTIESIEKEGISYILTTKYEGEDYTLMHKYIFNDDFLCSLQVYYDDVFEGEYNYNYSPIILEVPEEIKALESSATINVEDRIYDLKDTMSKYLESDFELIINGESYAKYDADNQISCTTEDSEQVWMWLNGDYCYTHYNGEDHLDKYNSFAWEDRLKSYLFTEDALSESGFEYSVTISSDAQYYELTITTNDEEDAIFKYTFNDGEIAKLEVSYNGSVDVVATYVKKSINLEVPEEIKALESSTQ